MSIIKVCRDYINELISQQIDAEKSLQITDLF